MFSSSKPRFAGLGTALPRARVSQETAAEFASLRLGVDDERMPKLVRQLYKRSGVESRHTAILDGHKGDDPNEQNFYRPSASADDRGPSTSLRMQAYREAAGGLAIEAATKALADAAVDASEIDHLVTVSCTGFSSPGCDFAIVDALGMLPSTTRTHVGFMGCHGVMNALRVAKGYLADDPDARVLICAVELCTLHHQYGTDPQQIVANSLFADGAGAVVLDGRDGGDEAAWSLRDSRSLIVPESTSAMTWDIGDHGFEMTLDPAVPSLIREHLPGCLDEWLGRHALAVDDIACVAVHPGGPRILQACACEGAFAEGLLAPSQRILARYGNMSSPTILFVLESLRAEYSGKPCVVLGFGPGLTVEFALLS